MRRETSSLNNEVVERTTRSVCNIITLEKRKMPAVFKNFFVGSRFSKSLDKAFNRVSAACSFCANKENNSEKRRFWSGVLPLKKVQFLQFGESGAGFCLN